MAYVILLLRGELMSNKKFIKIEELKNREDGIMSTCTMEYKALDINKLRNKPSKFISSKEALQDIAPIQWNEKVLSGKTKIIIDKKK